MKFAIATIALASSFLVSSAPISRRSTGSGTWYDIESGQTACGGRYKGSDLLLAVSAPLFDANRDKGICGRKVSITGPATNQPVTATVVDRCEGCAKYDLDMTSGLFKKVVGNLDRGRADVTWNFI